MKPRERAAYSAIVDRPPLRLPQGLRLVIWPVVNLEVWEIERPMARQVLPAPTGVAVSPDLPNWAWHEYGMRIGVWRFFDAFDRFGIPSTLSINANVVDIYPRVAAAARERNWEFMGHALMQMPIHQISDQRAMIAQSLDKLEGFTGKRPKGWLGPGLTETEETPDLLAEAGVRYVGDWVYDDEPGEIATSAGALVTLPYTVELNDIPMMMVQHHRSEVFFERARSIRPALSRRRRARQNPLLCDPSLHLGRATPDQVSRGVSRLCARPCRRRLLDGRGDSRLVSPRAPRGISA